MTLVRFAPSPTGPLHAGNARVALINWLFARNSGGRFLLRLDDTDRERSEEPFVAAIEADLAWLGLDWDLRARQSERQASYAAAIADLKTAGRLYPCYETGAELAAKRAAQRAAGKPPRYDRAALRLGPAERRALERALEREGRRPHWRLQLPDKVIAWNDLVRGEQRFPSGSLSDPVLLREDGCMLYTLASVVDDLEMGVTHVLRGEDHVANTAAQIASIEALGGAVPAFGHFPLLVDAAGRGLSKRLRSLSLESLRGKGVEALSLCAYLARLGTGQPLEPCRDLAQLAARFDIAAFGRAPARFEAAALDRLNARLLQQLPFAAVAGRLPGLDAALWQAVRGNLERLSDLEHWIAVREGKAVNGGEDPAFLAAAAALLPPEPWDRETWGRWTGAVAAASGRKGKALFLPLRLALTARRSGPEMAALLPLLPAGRVRAGLMGDPMGPRA
ncbi:MAG: glutamate--tRNA ligase [Rhodospirillales bacterium]|nr:glutamate--tRNA ligase [Rhodospirillales bacterium]